MSASTSSAETELLDEQGTRFSVGPSGPFLLTETQTTFPQNTGAKITYTYPNIPNQGVVRGIASYTVGPLYDTGYSPRVDYVYDGAGRVTDMHWSPLNGGFHIDYNANGGYSLITYPNGQLRSFAYDDQGRLTQVANTHPTLGDPGDLATFTYSYDHNWATGTETMLGQRTSVTVTGSPAPTSCWARPTIPLRLRWRVGVTMRSATG